MRLIVIFFYHYYLMYSDEECHLPHLIVSVVLTTSFLGQFISLIWLNSSSLIFQAPGTGDIYKGAWRQVFLIVLSSERHSKSIGVWGGRARAVNCTGYSYCCATESAVPDRQNSEIEIISSVFSFWLFTDLK